MKANLIEYPDQSAIKTVESRFPPHPVTYQVTVAFARKSEAQDFVNGLEAYGLEEIPANPSVHTGDDTAVNSTITASGDGKLVATVPVVPVETEFQGSGPGCDYDWTQHGDGTDYPQGYTPYVAGSDGAADGHVSEQPTATGWVSNEPIPAESEAPHEPTEQH